MLPLDRVVRAVGRAALPAALVVHWLLIELELPHRIHSLDFEKLEQKSPAYLKINPAGVVPTLVIDGRPICEAPAIAMHLGDLVPGRDLAPAPGTLEREQYYQWMFFAANTLHPAYRAWFYPTEPAGEANVEATRHQARERIEWAWGRVAAHLEMGGPYILGANLSVVDFLLTMLMRWSRNMPRPTDGWPVLRAYAQRSPARNTVLSMQESKLGLSRPVRRL